MEEVTYKGKEYYMIRKNTFWVGAIVVIIVMAMALFRMYADAADEVLGDEYKESYEIEYGSLESKLVNIEECYLCGNEDRSLMGYYRKFDTVGIIGLNEWCVIDLRLKAHDKDGNEIQDSGSNGMSGGNNQGVYYEVDSMASRGMSRANVSSEKEFDATCIQNNLCQGCLDKVTATLERYCTKGEKETFNPFVLVDFETLDIYSLQGNYTGMSVREYWVEVECEDGETKVDVYYLPNIK